ncbi:MAG: Hsp20/alpha crystallin family protein [Candidatus Riflebacteria bacterium]|nr:Hsp20/alpha crystallin family protein [Candidatus Riflebacteria bacterium]
MTRESTELQKVGTALPAKTEKTESVPLFTPRTDVYENEAAFHVVADMPGVDERSIDIQVDHNVLSVAGRAEAESFEGHELELGEYLNGSFVRQFTLPVDIDVEKIEATVRDGVVRIRLPKSDEAKPRKITVRSA